MEGARVGVMVEVNAHFRPKFLNRVDEILFFERLKPEHKGAIVDIQMKRLHGWLKDKHITLELTDKARTWIGEQGYDPSYGARPLKRVIQKNVQDTLAREILAGRIQDGQNIKLDEKDLKIVLEAISA